MWIYFTVGLFLGTVAGIFVAGLCQMAARSKELRNVRCPRCDDLDSSAAELVNPALHELAASPWEVIPQRADTSNLNHSAKGL